MSDGGGAAAAAAAEVPACAALGGGGGGAPLLLPPPLARAPCMRACSARAHASTAASHSLLKRLPGSTPTCGAPGDRLPGCGAAHAHARPAGVRSLQAAAAQAARSVAGAAWRRYPRLTFQM